ncbi:MAG: hypothetical protein C5B53_07050 [Candidatus Melainabacteria bacterium]|nr:MAG: hypothetical protein C5B53_07050 [Candidatus Melainabacteria bacterium]
MVAFEKTLKFPHRKSIGTLYIASVDQPEEWELLSQVRGLVVTPENQPIRWEWLEEARGSVKVPGKAKIKLKISTRGAGLSPLNDLAGDDLHALDLSHSQVSDTSLSHLAGLTGLKVLELTSTCIGDEGLKAIMGLDNLQSLGMSYSRVTSVGLKFLKDLKNLREIWLSGTAVDDSGLENFGEMSLLVQLGLSSTKVTDSGLRHLAQLHNLLRVYLFNTRVSHNGAQALKSSIPGCRVKWHPTKTHTGDAYDPDFNTAAEQDAECDLGVRATESFAEERFWQIIERLDWQKNGDDTAVIEPAVSALAAMAPEEILGFAEQLAEKLYMLDGQAYACEIGRDSYKGVRGDFSKNWFLYVRCCVVANGRDFYQEVLSDPKEMPKDMEFQSLLAIAAKAYKRKTGRRFNYATKYNYETFSNKELWGRP